MFWKKDQQPMQKDYDTISIASNAYEPPSKTIIKLRDGGYWYVDNTYEEVVGHIAALWRKHPDDYNECIIALNVVGYDEEIVAFKYSELTSVIKLKDRRGNEAD